jgi:hypothetical protein
VRGARDLARSAKKDPDRETGAFRTETPRDWEEARRPGERASGDKSVVSRSVGKSPRNLRV